MVDTDYIVWMSIPPSNDGTMFPENVYVYLFIFHLPYKNARIMSLKYAVNMHIIYPY